MGIRLVVSLGIGLFLTIPWSAVAIAAPLEPGSILISEIQTDGATGEEFIELFNPAIANVAVNGLQIKYKSATGPSWIKKADLTGEIAAGAFKIFTLTGLNNTEGHLCVALGTDDCSMSGQALDKVGWGDKANSAEGSPATSPMKGSSIQRCFQGNVLADTNNNLTDLKDYGSISPGSAIECPPPQEEPSAPGPSCEGIILSEILPNAVGTDAGHEFIELHNPTNDFIDVAGCGLQLTGNDHIHRFSSIILQPGTYKTFSDTEIGITLPNSSGGTVYLLSAANEELQTINYPGDLEDDVAWAWFGGVNWTQTYAPTPNAANVSQSSEPCPAGQERNSDTGRCLASGNEATGLKPCDLGQERNPATNRCRALATLAAALTPCKPGQERNPETNRCRAIASATSQLKPCAPGQERNPETNRCRKAADGKTGAGKEVKDIEAPGSSTANWWLAGIAATGAAGYGLWEWRRDIVGFIARLTKRDRVLG